MNYSISIIMPIYNVQEYLEQSLQSILNQNFKSIEYIFIDDCSTDNSVRILNETIKNFPHRLNDIKIIYNPENKGISYTRKIGMQAASGKYVIQIDSDDWVELNMCYEFYLIAKETNADIITSDYYENYKNKQNYIKQNYKEKPNHFKSLLLGGLHGSLCNKLIKRNLYVDFNIYPIEDFNLFEDKFISLKLFTFSKKTIYVSKAFLHYRKHEDSFTAQPVKEKHIKDTILFLKYLHDFLEKNNLYEKYENEFNSCVLYHKKIFLLDDKYYHLWDGFYPKVNRIKYVFGIELYDFKKKIVTILTLLVCKDIMKIAYSNYRKKRSR